MTTPHTHKEEPSVLQAPPKCKHGVEGGRHLCVDDEPSDKKQGEIDVLATESIKNDVSPTPEEWEKKFHKRFGNVWEYEKEHTDWWVKKIYSERQRVREEMLEEVLNELKVYRHDVAQSEMAANMSLYLKAIDVVINRLETKTETK